MKCRAVLIFVSIVLCNFFQLDVSAYSGIEKVVTTPVSHQLWNDILKENVSEASPKILHILQLYYNFQSSFSERSRRRVFFVPLFLLLTGPARPDQTRRGEAEDEEAGN